MEDMGNKKKGTCQGTNRGPANNSEEHQCREQSHVRWGRQKTILKPTTTGEGHAPWEPCNQVTRAVTSSPRMLGLP